MRKTRIFNYPKKVFLLPIFAITLFTAVGCTSNDLTKTIVSIEKTYEDESTNEFEKGAVSENMAIHVNKEKRVIKGFDKSKKKSTFRDEKQGLTHNSNHRVTMKTKFSTSGKIVIDEDVMYSHLGHH